MDSGPPRGPPASSELPFTERESKVLAAKKKLRNFQRRKFVQGSSAVDAADGQTMGDDNNDANYTDTAQGHVPHGQSAAEDVFVEVDSGGGLLTRVSSLFLNLSTSDIPSRDVLELNIPQVVDQRFPEFSKTEFPAREFRDRDASSDGPEGDAVGMTLREHFELDQLVRRTPVQQYAIVL